MIQSFVTFVRELFQQRYVFYTLVKRDFQNRYLSSAIGLPWAFVQPLFYVIFIGFALHFGLRGSGAKSGQMQMPNFTIAMMAWLYISQTMNACTRSLQDYSYIIKKTSFNVSFIPLVKIFSGLVIHLVTIAVLLMVFVFAYGIHPSVHWVQILYYLFATILLLSGIAWLVSSINVIFKDMGHAVSLATSMLFWVTPIIWSYEKLPGNYKYVALLNPFFYITEGYRFTFLKKTWFFTYAEMNLYFWAVTSFILFAGIFTFRKLRKEFGDYM